VLSISNNRLRRLPAWLAHMRHLRILKVEQNPIEWPPPHISVMPAVPKLSLPLPGSVPGSTARDRREEKEAIANAKKKAEDRHMAGWIGQVKGWIKEHQGGSNTAGGKPRGSRELFQNRFLRLRAEEGKSPETRRQVRAAMTSERWASCSFFLSPNPHLLKRQRRRRRSQSQTSRSESRSSMRSMTPITRRLRLVRKQMSRRR
jgi:hypothetical protein